ncbi:MAG: nitroreductase family deazaflavin-dependent oxidoreductase [Polyangiales bacterium]
MPKHEYVSARREDVRPIPQRIVPFVRRMTKFFTRVNVAVYKASGGRLMSKFQGQSICLVTMVGAKSGKAREVPLMHVPIDDKKILVASQGGLEMHPAWYYNLKANPEIEILAEGVKRRYLARQVDEEEKGALWPVIVASYADYDEYQARTDRDIPVFVCDPVG